MPVFICGVLPGMRLWYQTPEVDWVMSLNPGIVSKMRKWDLKGGGTPYTKDFQPRSFEMGHDEVDIGVIGQESNPV